MSRLSHAQRRQVEAYLPVVDVIAGRIARTSRVPRQVLREDLVQAGTLGLIDAVCRFSSARGASLRTFAGLRIRGAILDYLRAEDPLGREDRAFVRAGGVVFAQEQLEHLPFAELDALESPEPWPDAGVLVNEVLATVDRALSVRDRRVIRGVFLEERYAADLAVELGVCASRVSQLKTRAIARLRVALEGACA